MQSGQRQIRGEKQAAPDGRTGPQQHNLDLIDSPSRTLLFCRHGQASLSSYRAAPLPPNSQVSLIERRFLRYTSSRNVTRSVTRW